MRILLDAFYLYQFMAAPGQFSEAERRFFKKNDAQHLIGHPLAITR